MSESVKRKNLKCKFSNEEYESLRNEIITRMTLTNNQASNAIVTIISAWVAGISLLVFSSGSDEIRSGAIITISYVESLVFLIPIFFFIPLAVKSGENIQQTASLSAYIRVFYEYPSMKRQGEIKNWEMTNALMSSSLVDRGRSSYLMYFYNAEYTILSSVSLFLYGICACSAYNSISAVSTSRCNLQMHGVIFTILGLIGFICVMIIHKTSYVKKVMMDKLDWYITGYIKRAIQLGVISESFEAAYSLLNPQKSVEDL